jgi:periplasmic protein TonB
MRMRIAVICLVVFSCCFGAAAAGQNEPAANDGSRKVLRKVNPVYPAIAKQMGLAGTVRVVAVVTPDGSVKKVEPVGGSPLLVQAAASAISQWKYAPGAESRESVELHFHP